MQDFGSLLEYTPWSADYDGPLPDLAAGEDPLEFPAKDSPPAKRPQIDTCALGEYGRNGHEMRDTVEKGTIEKVR